MVTLTERTIMKSRSGVYLDTSENRRKHRVGQKYGAEKQPEDGEKTEKKEADPAKELEAVNKVIAAINEGKLNLPAAEVMKLSEKKQKLEAAKKQAEKINSGVKANEEKKNAEEAKETSKKINEAQKKERIQSLDSELEQLEEKREKALRDRFYISSKDEEGEELNRKEINDLSDKIDKLRKEKAKLESKKKKEESSSKKSAEMDSGEKINEAQKEEVNNLQRRKELSEKVERLISEKKKKFPNPDIESPMSDEEKRLTKEIADTWSEINKLIQENRKSKEESKSEPKQGETEESYTRVKFDDVPNSGKINLKKYLSEKVRKGVDEKWSNIKNIPTENLKKMEKGLVNDLNKNFEAIKKSQRAELLYSIMKVKGELESRGKETSKEGSKESGKLSDLQSKVPGYMNMPEYKKYISAKSEVDNFGKVPSGGDKRQRYDELNEQLIEATKKYKEALKKKLTT